MPDDILKEIELMLFDNMKRTNQLVLKLVDGSDVRGLPSFMILKRAMD